MPVFVLLISSEFASMEIELLTSHHHTTFLAVPLKTGVATHPAATLDMAFAEGRKACCCSSSRIMPRAAPAGQPHQALRSSHRRARRRRQRPRTPRAGRRCRAPLPAAAPRASARTRGAPRCPAATPTTARPRAPPQRAALGSRPCALPRRSSTGACASQSREPAFQFPGLLV